MTQGDFFQELLLNLNPPKLESGTTWIDPYANAECQRCLAEFCAQYFGNTQKRHVLLGINPGRFGAGITGIPFTDPVQLENFCGISNSLEKRAELSSEFVKRIIDDQGGPDRFYERFIISSVCPLGLLRDQKNLNYYDIDQWQEKLGTFIVRAMDDHMRWPIHTDVVFLIGQGQNTKAFKALNDRHQWFDKVIPLPHPRWVMQYRRKRLQEFVAEYAQKLSAG